MPAAVVVDRTLLSDPSLRRIADLVERGERLTVDDGVALFESTDIVGVGALANAVNGAKHGDRVMFAANQHINPTNICTLRKTCVFCSYARLPKEEGAYRYTLEQVLQEAATSNSTLTREFHIGEQEIKPSSHDILLAGTGIGLRKLRSCFYGYR